jgi:hypothetical protein
VPELGSIIGLVTVPEASLAYPKSKVVKAQTLNQEQNGGAGDMCATKAATMPRSATEGMVLGDQRIVSILIKKQLSNTNIFH